MTLGRFWVLMGALALVACTDARTPASTAGGSTAGGSSAAGGDGTMAGGSGAGGAGATAGGSGTSAGGTGSTAGGSGTVAGGSGSSAGGTGSTAGGSGTVAGGAGSTAGGSTAGGSASTAGGGTLEADAGVQTAGDCLSDDDCRGGACVALFDGGFRTCVVAPEPVEGCDPPGNDFDECCSSDDCRGAVACVRAPLVPFCGGLPPPEQNVCAEDQCRSDVDCHESQRCVPAGTFGRQVASCMLASCTSNADCDAAPGGRCIALRSPCCGQPMALACTYPDDGCEDSNDCPDGHCDLRDGRAVCIDGPVFCPA